MFALDEMHMIGHGLCYQLVSLMEGGKRDKKDYTNSDLYLGPQETARLFGLMEDSLPNIPTSFDGAFKKPFGKHSTRAVDWIDMTRYVIPALFVPRLVDPLAQTAVLSLISCIQIALQKSISPEDLYRMKR
jgi:hypothetical protein